MITKVAVIEIKKGMEKEFIAGVKKAVPLFLDSEGCHGLALERSVEFPEQFTLRVQWETVSHNLDLFVNSQNFTAWRTLVGHCFASKPRIHHAETLFSRESQASETAERVAI